MGTQISLQVGRLVYLYHFAFRISHSANRISWRWMYVMAESIKEVSMISNNVAGDCDLWESYNDAYKYENCDYRNLLEAITPRFWTAAWKEFQKRISERATRDRVRVVEMQPKFLPITSSLQPANNYLLRAHSQCTSRHLCPLFYGYLCLLGTFTR